MPPKLPPTERSPHGMSLDQALGRSEPLTRLTERLRDSAARFAVVRPLLPEALAAHVSPGPVDEQGWSLLAANTAVGAKLRQLKPRLEQALRDAGWAVYAVRVKVRAGG